MASFIGADKGKRDLHLQQRADDGGLTLVVDGDGRPVGVLGEAQRRRDRDEPVVSWTFDNLDLIRELTLDHVRLAIIPIVLSFVLVDPARLAGQPQPRLAGRSSSRAAACSTRSRRCRCS